MVDKMPRLACPDLQDSIKRWQQLWEYRKEPGTHMLYGMAAHTPFLHLHGDGCIGKSAKEGPYLVTWKVK